MPAEDWLDYAVVAYFIREFGSEYGAMLAAMELPGFKQAFARLSVTLENGDPKFPTREIEGAAWKLTAAAYADELAVGRADTGGATVSEVEPDLSGRPLPAAAVVDALVRYADQETAYSVARDTALNRRGAERVETWDKSRTVWWDARHGKVQVARGYRLVQDGPADARTVRLIRD
jgi:hypothetical protein